MTKTVLVVEDELIIAMGLQMLLQTLGYGVVGPVGHLEQAVRTAESETFDCALLDVSLRGKAAYPVADVLTARGIPFVFLTGYARDSVPPPYATHKILAKPVRPEQLLATLAELTGEKPGGSGLGRTGSPGHAE